MINVGGRLRLEEEAPGVGSFEAVLSDPGVGVEEGVRNELLDEPPGVPALLGV